MWITENNLFFYDWSFSFKWFFLHFWNFSFIDVTDIFPSVNLRICLTDLNPLGNVTLTLNALQLYDKKIFNLMIS